MKALILTVGLPRSGKSTWAQTQPYPTVSPDAVRLAVHGQRYFSPVEPLIWGLVRIMVRSLFLGNHDVVILDATSVRRKLRDNWSSPDWDTFFKVLRTPKAECRLRADRGGRSDLLPVIEKMALEWEELGPTERLWLGDKHDPALATL
jgi:predicted kinase